jgi:membrane-associated protease RseP (regulator of RpoE activity)
MIYAFALFLIFLAVLVHEIGHAIAMVKTGIGVKELGIGIGGSRWPRLSHTFVSKKDPEETFTLSIYPLLIGALVRPQHEDRIKELCYRDQAFIFGAGIIANIFFTLVCMFVLRVFFPEVHSRVFPAWISPWMLVAAIVPLFWYARAITAYIFPLFSIAIMYWFVTSLLKLSGTALIENSGGIVFAGQIAQNFSKEIWQAIYFGGFISFALAATNVLPIYPLDGGLTMSALIHRFSSPVGQYFNRLGSLLFFVLIFYSVGGDIRRVWLMTQ